MAEMNRNMDLVKTVAVVFLGLVHLVSAVSQTPNIKACSGSTTTSIIAFDDITVSNVKVGETMSLKYTVQLKQQVDGNPQLKFTMTSGSSTLPCINEVGSCTYKLCGATGKVEKQIAASWNNKCPIPAGTYTNSLSMKIPSLASLLIQGDTIHIKIEGQNNGKILGCVEFDVDIEE